MTTETASALHTAEIVHWAALGVMALVYTLRLAWLLKFNATRDRSAPGAAGAAGAKQGAYYSLANVVMPWSMESTRKGMAFYLSFVIFHLGVVAGISMAFLSTVWPALFTHPVVGNAFFGMLGAACLVGIGRLFRRLTTPYLRLISTPDDYFSLVMLICWFALGTVTQGYMLGMPAFQDPMYLVAYLYLTSFFLLYVPFSKISHYLYYPFTRWYIGKALGHRGSLPIMRKG